MTFFVALLFGLFVVIVLLFCLYFMIAVFVGAPFLPTGKQYVEKMLAMAELQSGENFVDLGSGDGRFVVAAAKRGARAVGYEMNPFLVAFGKMRIRFAGVRGRASIRWQNLWDADLHGVDVVSVFGITSMMRGLEQKFERELPQGSRVVSYIFSLPNWKPVMHKDGIRVYKK